MKLRARHSDRKYGPALGAYSLTSGLNKYETIVMKASTAVTWWVARGSEGGGAMQGGIGEVHQGMWAWASEKETHQSASQQSMSSRF